MHSAAPSLQSLSHSSPQPALAFTVQERGVHPLMKVVRATYRAQHRKPQFEPICVRWIERFVRAYPTLPVGRLGSQHVQAFLADLTARGEAPDTHAQAREALQFLQTEVLRSV